MIKLGLLLILLVLLAWSVIGSMVWAVMSIRKIKVTTKKDAVRLSIIYGPVHWITNYFKEKDDK